MRRGEFIPPNTQVWYTETLDEIKHSEKRYKANGIPTKLDGDELTINVPDSIILIYKLDPQTFEEQLSFL